MNEGSGVDHDGDDGARGDVEDSSASDSDALAKRRGRWPKKKASGKKSKTAAAPSTTTAAVAGAPVAAAATPAASSAGAAAGTTTAAGAAGAAAAASRAASTPLAVGKTGGAPSSVGGAVNVTPDAPAVEGGATASTPGQTAVTSGGSNAALSPGSASASDKKKSPSKTGQAGAWVNVRFRVGWRRVCAEQGVVVAAVRAVTHLTSA